MKSLIRRVLMRGHYLSNNDLNDLVDEIDLDDQVDQLDHIDQA
jgi:hypothetical protein